MTRKHEEDKKSVFQAFVYEHGDELTLYVFFAKTMKCVWANRTNDFEKVFSWMAKVAEWDSVFKLGESDQALIDNFNKAVNLYDVQLGTIIGSYGNDLLSFEPVRMCKETRSKLVELLANRLTRVEFSKHDILYY